MLQSLAHFLDSVRDSLVPVFEIFRDERVAIGLSLCLLTLAVVLGLKFWLLHMAPWLRSLKRAEKRVLTAAGAADLLEHFADIDADLARNKKLAHGWQEFKESLIIPGGEVSGGESSGRRSIRNTARPQLYLNVHSAVEAGLPLPSFLALPNLFVGLGLLFTFIGLVAALHFAAAGVTSADVAEAQLSLQALLKAATFKFMTSITGVFLSIVLSLVSRRWVRKLQTGFERLCKALEERLDYVSTAGLAAEQLQELECQTQTLERFNTDFAVELAGVLDDRLNRTLAASLTHAVQPVVRAVENLSGNMGSMNQGAVESMIKDFQTGLKQSAGDELGSVVAALGQVRQTLDQAAIGLQANGADFGSRLEHAAVHLESRLGEASRAMTEGLTGTGAALERTLRDLSEQMRVDAAGAASNLSNAVAAAGDRTLAAFDQVGKTLSAEVQQMGASLAEALAPSLAALPAFEQTLKTLDGSLSQHVGAFEASMTRLRSLAEEFERTNRSLRDAAAPIATTSGQFAAAAQQIEAAGIVLQEAPSRLVDLTTQLSEVFDSNRRVWDDYRGRFEQVDRHLEGMVKALAETCRTHHQELRDFVTNLDHQLATAVNSLAGAISELGEVAEEFNPGRRAFHGHAQADTSQAAGRTA